MQQRFFESAKLRSGLSWKQFRLSLGISNHVHYRYEDCSLPSRVFKRALQIANMSPSYARKFRYSLRKERGETVITLRRNAALAEFLGICLGDGNLEHHWTAIFGDKLKDTIYLRNYVIPLIRKVTDINPRFSTTRPDENFVILYSTALSRALHKQGLPYGDKIKNKAQIPLWIFARKKMLEACIRGLFDTDGCVYGFRRQPPARGRKAIVSFEFGKDSLLAGNVFRALHMLGYSPRLMPNRNECRLGFNKDVVMFMNKIKPANMKHWHNFLRWHGPVV